jgi:GNAT superfamily N-acetyltransferase
MSLTANGKLTTTTSSTSPNPNLVQETIIIRPAHLTDGPQIGRIAARTYYSIPLTTFLWPHREKHYADYERGFIERTTSRMLSPRNITFVACTAAEPGTALGYAQFARLGDDVGARKLICEVGLVRRVLLWVLGWLFWVYCLLLLWLRGGDKAADKEAVKMFAECCEQDHERFWGKHEERANRWYAQSVVVLEEWQGKGIGKRLMGEVILRAEREGIVVGLESSKIGEGLYRRLGFEFLGRCNERMDWLEGDGVGGVMMWCPRGWKEREREGES